MSEAGKPNGDTNSGQQAIQVQILGQYVKDLSFENPGALQMGPSSAPPQIDLGVDLQAKPIDPERFELEMKLRVSAQSDGKALFLLELVYAGLILVRSAPQEFIQQILYVDVAHLIFPFARRIVADAIRDGGMPPLMIEPIDFAAMYRARAEQQGQLRPGTMTA